MADINDLAQRIAFLQAGGKDPGNSPIDQFNQGFNTVKGIGDTYLGTIKQVLANKQTQLENQQKQGQLTPMADIQYPLTKENSTITPEMSSPIVTGQEAGPMTPEQQQLANKRADVNSLYAKREAMGNTTLDQAKTKATIDALGAGTAVKLDTLKNSAEKIWVNKQDHSVSTTPPPQGQEDNWLEFGKKEATAPVLKGLIAPAGGVNDQQVKDTLESIRSGKMALSQLPGFGLNSLKSKVIALGNQLYPDMSWIKNESDFQAIKNYTRYINSGPYQNTIKYLESVQPNMDTLLQVSDKIKRTQFPPINSLEMKALMATGDPDVAAYGAAATEVADQIAKILQGGGTGNGTSDAKLNQAQSLLNSSFTPQQLVATIQVLKPMLANRQQALENETVKKLSSGSIEGDGSPKPTNTPHTPPPPAQTEQPPGKAQAAIRAANGKPVTFANGQTWTFANGKFARTK